MVFTCFHLLVFNKEVRRVKWAHLWFLAMGWWACRNIFSSSTFSCWSGFTICHFSAVHLFSHFLSLFQLNYSSTICTVVSFELAPRWFYWVLLNHCVGRDREKQRLAVSCAALTSQTFTFAGGGFLGLYAGKTVSELHHPPVLPAPRVSCERCSPTGGVSLMLFWPREPATCSMLLPAVLLLTI